MNLLTGMCGVLFAPLSPFHFNFYLLCCILSFDIIVKRCEAAHAWVVSGAIEISVYYYFITPMSISETLGDVLCEWSRVHQYLHL